MFMYEDGFTLVLERKIILIGETPEDAGILQSESKMKACLGQKVKISLLNAKRKWSLVIKGGPAEVKEQKFKKFLDLNKIIYAKAERLTSKKTVES